MWEKLPELHDQTQMKAISPLCGQRLQTRALRIDPNVLMMLQLLLTYYSTFTRALFSAACRHLSRSFNLSSQTFLPPPFFSFPMLLLETVHWGTPPAPFFSRSLTCCWCVFRLLPGQKTIELFIITSECFLLPKIQRNRVVYLYNI